MIVRTDRIGDVILTLPMAQALRRLYPHARIAMLIRRYTAPLVEDHPAVDDYLLYDDGEQPTPFFRMVRELRAGRFDLVLHTHPRPRVALMTFLAGIPTRVGTGYRWYSALFNRRVYEHRRVAAYHELEYNLHLLRAIGAEVDPSTCLPSIRVAPEAAQAADAALASIGVAPGSLLVVVHPGSGGSARDWPWRKFGELAARLSTLPGVRVLVTGGRGEEELVGRVLGVAGERVASLVDRLDLRAFAALLQRASLFIANSTGPLHMAAAVGTPVIGFYPQVTPLSAARWGPYTSDRTIFSPAGKPSDCTTCVGASDTTCSCMDDIGVDEVFDAARTALSRHTIATAHG